jgi:hypothetical protein
MDFILIALIAWDILYINNNHLWEIAILFPFIVLLVPILILFLTFVLGESKPGLPTDRMPLTYYMSKYGGLVANRWVICMMGVAVFGGGLYFLQSYRENTRYLYYRKHLDLHDFPRTYVDAWEFLDQPAEHKTIAMTAGWDPPSHKWFFYPLLGRRLQNDIAYVSAKSKWDVPTWVHRGLLRGNVFSIWLFNLKREKIDYILVQKPWPLELQWIEREQKLFQLVFSNRDCKIFKCNKDT